MRNNRSNGKRRAKRIEIPTSVKRAIIVSCICILILFFLTIFALLTSVSNKVIARVSVNGCNVSNLTIDEAYQKLNEELAENKKKNIILKHQEYETTISLEQLEVGYKTDEAINNAYKIGRSRNIIISNFQIISNLLFGNKLQEPIQINEEQLEKLISDIEVKIPDSLIQNSYYIENDQLIITKGKEGIILKKEELKETIIKTIEDRIYKKQDKIITIPVEKKKPEELNIENIYKDIYKEAKDAYYEKETKTLYKEENGIDFAISKE